MITTQERETALAILDRGDLPHLLRVLGSIYIDRGNTAQKNKRPEAKSIHKLGSSLFMAARVVMKAHKKPEPNQEQS